MTAASRLRRSYRSLAKIVFFLTFLVILAGAVVRSTQSGMGCPDWPRCYGYYIPPTDPAQVTFQPGHFYRKGMMVIRNDTLWRATASFTSGLEFGRKHWEKYPKHDYAKFVVYQTWIEYVNRLLGALLGVFVFLLFIASLGWWNSRRSLFWLAAGLLFSTGFQGWLGALVVASNLAPVKITLHMLAALLIVALGQVAVHKSSNRGNAKKLTVQLRQWVAIAISLTLTQIFLGTQVREGVDKIAAALDYASRDTWIAQLPAVFVLHRSFSILVVVFNAWLIYRVVRAGNERAARFAMFSGFLVLAEILLGIVLNYAGFPALVQPAHLLLATMLFSAQVEMWLNTGASSKRETAIPTA